MKLRNWMAVGLAAALLVVPVGEQYRLMPQATQLTAAAADNSCGDNLTWSLSGSTLYISGSGKMTDYASYEPSPWYDSRDSIQSVSVSGATTIGAAAFANCTKLTSVNLPNGITSLGAASFSGCTEKPMLCAMSISRRHARPDSARWGFAVKNNSTLNAPE